MRHSGPALLALALLIGGCASASIEDAVPGAPPVTGNYPNLNIPPQVATTQLSPEEVAAAKARLQALATARSREAAAEPPSEAARLKKLGETHAGEALEAIEE